MTGIASQPKQGTLFDETLGVEAFGKRLIATKDLDPVYVGLVGAKLPRAQLARWLLCYWCFYDVGAASWMSEQDGTHFWPYMAKAADNLPEHSPRGLGLPAERWPRASERRHFRGKKSVEAVQWLARKYPRPEDCVERVATAKTAEHVMAVVDGWPMFGKWAAFKIADMMERVWGAPIRFPENTCLMYDEPLAGLKLAAQRAGNANLESYHDQLLDYFERFPAPPTDDRPAGPQELETACCKWKSYVGGHYVLGRDIREHRAALVGWGATANRILSAYPQLVF
jgi:hypothetical protein